MKHFCLVPPGRVRARLPVVLLLMALITGCLLPAAGVRAEPLLTAGPVFGDLDGHWANAVISLLATRGIVAGFADGYYYPAEILTRAQFAKLAVAGLEGGGAASLLGALPPVFSDLVGHWSRGWVAAGRELGLVLGDTDGRFNPDSAMTRAQVTAVLVRAMGWDVEARQLSTARALEMLAGYADRQAVANWALPYMAIGASRGLLRGYEDLTLRPDMPVTRAEGAVLLARALDRLSLLFTLGGWLVAVEPSGALALEGIWGWDEGQAPAGLTVQSSARTVWFRNGQAVQPADLLPGDRVLLTLDETPAGGAGGSLWAGCVYALSWDVTGTLASAVDSSLTLTLPSSAGSLTLAVGPRTRYYRHGVAAAASELMTGDRIYSLVDPLTGLAEVVDAVQVAAAGTLAAAASAGGQRYLDLVPAGDPGAAPSRHYLADNVRIVVNGLPGVFGELTPGMQVVLAQPSEPGTGSATYCEAWEDATSASGGELGAAAVSQSLVRRPAPEYVSPGATLAASGGPRAAQAAAAATAEGLGVSIGATGAEGFWSRYGADGAGVTIAVVDTGTDASHYLLSETSTGEPKIVDWVDFTGEGLVETAYTARALGGYVTTRLGLVRLGSVVSRSGVYHSGALDEALLLGGAGLDLNGNGLALERFPVVLVDAALPGVYDTVLIDTNGNRDLRDEQPLQVYGRGGQVVNLRTAATFGCGVVVCGLDYGGGQVSLGFDGNGHGTHVAGVAAGYDPTGQRPVVGMAPGASLMILKALSGDGGGSWSDIKLAVEYAATHGADIVVLAIEGPGSGGVVPAEYRGIAATAAANDILVFMAGGNSGPGIGTAAQSPDSEVLVKVGGYVSSAMWSGLFGQQVAGDTVWLRSSAGAGPAAGGASPLFLAPAAAVSSVSPIVTATTSRLYELYEGTSVAVPHAAGAAALLLAYARQTGGDVDSRCLSRALCAGARQLNTAAPVEQGFGVLDLLAAATQLVPSRRAPARVELDTADEAMIVLSDQGLVAGSWTIRLTNHGSQVARLTLESALGNLTPGRSALILPAGLSRDVRLDPAAFLEPGQDDIHDLIVARDLDTGQVRGEMVVHLPAVERMRGEPSPSVSLDGQVAAARMVRHYVQVPAGTAKLQWTVNIPSGAGDESQGAIRAYLYAPSAYLAAETGHIGRGAAAVRAQFEVLNPPPGVWEIVVWGVPEAGAVSKFATGLAATVLRASANPAEVSATQPGLWPGGRQTIVLDVLVPADTGELTVEAYGWMYGDAAPQATAYAGSVRGTSSRLWLLPEVQPDSGLMDISLVGLAAGDADLFLYYLEGGTEGAWLDAGSSRRVGATAERLTVWQPAAGQFAAVAEGQSAGEGDYGVALSVTRYPAGTLVLDRRVVPVPAGGGAGVRRVELSLPLPVGQGRYRADIIIRDGRTLVPLLTLPWHIEREEAQAVPLLAPKLTGGVGAANGIAGSPLVRVLGLTPAPTAPAVTVVSDGRLESGDGGQVRLTSSLLGPAGARDGLTELEIRVPGYTVWRGRLYLPAAGVLGSYGGGDVDGLGIYRWAAADAGLRAALRLKTAWLESQR